MVAMDERGGIEEGQSINPMEVVDPKRSRVVSGRSHEGEMGFIERG